MQNILLPKLSCKFKRRSFLSTAIAIISFLVWRCGAQMTPNFVPWPHAKSPGKLRYEILKTRQQFEELGGLNHGDTCDFKDTKDFEANKAFTKMNDAFFNKANYYEVCELYEDGKPLRKDNETLEKWLKDPDRKKIFCPISKGLICGDSNPKTCECKKKFYSRGDGNNKNIDGVAEYDKENSKCFLEEKSPCFVGWETRCKPPSQCLLKKEDANVPEKNRYLPKTGRYLCTQRNITKFNLDETGKGDWDCSCELDVETKKSRLEKLHKKSLGLTPLSFRTACKTDVHDLHNELEAAMGSDSEAETYYDDEKKYQVLKTAIDGANGPLFCDLTPSTKLTCDEANKECSCYPKGVYDNSNKKCVLKSGSPCVTENADGEPAEPHECPQGEKCVYKIVSDVLCTKKNTNRIEKNYPLLVNQKDKDGKVISYCNCAVSKGRKKFDQKALDVLDKKSKEAIKEEVEQLNKKVWFPTLQKGQGCERVPDRQYFDMQDFMRAGLHHVFYKYRLFQEVKDLEKLSDTDKNRKVCDLTKSLRCSFLTRQCNCPTDGYLNEDIPSELDPKGTGNCILKPKSLCHPTLTEWIKCQDGETCLYQEEPIECTRGNRLKIIQKKIIFKSAKCYCSPLEKSKIKTVEQISEKYKAQKREDL